MTEVASPLLPMSPTPLSTYESLRTSSVEFLALDLVSNPVALFQIESNVSRVSFVNRSLLSLLHREWEWIGRDLNSFCGSLLASWQQNSFMEFFPNCRENPKNEMILHIQPKEANSTKPYRARVHFLGNTVAFIMEPAVMENSEEISDFDPIPTNPTDSQQDYNFRPISRPPFGTVLNESASPSPQGSPAKERTAQVKQSPRRRSKSDRNEMTRSKSTETLTERLKPQAENHWRRRTQTLEAALEEKSRFMAIMSHEIRTPLFGIMGTLNLLSESGLTNQDLEMIRIALVCSEQLSAIINDILDFSKMQENKMVVEKTPFSIQQIIQDSLEVVAVEAGNKGIELVYDLFDKIPPRISSTWPSRIGEGIIPDQILGDSIRVRQILVNLLSNAVKFSNKGEIIVRVRTTSTEFLPVGSHVGKVMLHFSVEDNGVGIPDLARNRMFLPFSQAESSTARKYGGSGLGLSISKQLAQLMGGDMWFDSQEGSGSIFHFTISAELLQSFNGAFAPLVPNPTPMDPPKRVLLSVQNPLLSKVFQEQLVRWGFQVEVTLSRDQLIQMLLKQMKARNIVPIRAHRSAEDCRDRTFGRLRSSSESSAAGIFPFQLLIVDSAHLLFGMESSKNPGPAWTSWDFAMKSSLIGLLQNTEKVDKSENTTEEDDIFVKSDLLGMQVLCLDGHQVKDLPDRVKVIKKPIQIHMFKGALLEAFGLSKASEEISAQIAQNRLREKRGQELNLSLLVAEDNPLNQKVIKRILASLGIFDVDIVGDGAQAVEAVRRKKYDVVLMDVQMPVMGGIEASFTIQTSVEEIMRPVIVGLTADVQEENRLTCQSSGMAYFMAKPVNRDLLWSNLLEIAQSSGKAPLRLFPWNP